MRHSTWRATLFLALLLIAGKAYSQTDFKADITSGCLPLTVHFTDLTPGSNAWEWDFGNNNRSDLQNPSAVFSEAGTYTITLKATVGGVANTRIRANFIVVHGFPDANFTIDNVSGCSPLPVKFNDKTSTASGEVTSWFWVFGDGGTSQSANPTHVFQQPGDYTISLKARNEFGCEKTKSIESGVKVLGPKTKFSTDKTSICTLPAKFKFTNETTGDQPVTYQWNFGDGTTSTLKDPEHTYTQAGAFNVSLKARDASGCEGSYVMTVNAGGEGGLDFNASSFIECLGEPIDFTLISTDPVVTAEWKFGDGNSLPLRDPQYLYEDPGNYNVTLTAQLLNHTCPSVMTKKVEVANPAEPSFTSSVDCNYNLSLTSTSKHARRVEWYIDGVLVSTAGNFISPIKTAGKQTIRLVAFDAADCSYSKESEVVVPSNPIVSIKPDKLQDCTSPSLSGCAPFTVQFEGTVTNSDQNSVLWEFGDNTSSTSLTPVHVFNNAGLYQVTLTASNSKGCTGSTTAFVVVSKTTPAVDFIMDKTVACAGEEVTFTAKTQNADFWCWNLGDGTITNGEKLVHKYAKPGIYTVTLTAKNGGCSNSKTITNAIEVKDPFVNFTSFKSCADPFNVQLTNVSKNYDEIKWDFGDGQTSTVANVGSHHYDDPGTYLLQLTGKNNATGCTTTAFASLVVQQVSADFTIDNATPCKGAPFTLTDKSNGATTWLWTVGPNGSRAATFTTSLKTPGDYDARLEVTDVNGCTAVKIAPLKVLDMEGQFRFTATSNCLEFNVQFQNESTGTPPPSTWLWDFGDGETSTSKNPAHVYDTPGKYNVALSVSNATGTCTFMKTNAINFTVPEPDFVTAKKEFCIGEQVIVANTSKNAATYEWDYGDGRRADFISPVIVYDKTGEYEITLFAKDVYGCEKKIIKPSYVHVIKPTADFKVDNASGACPPFTARFQDASAPNIQKWEWQFGDGKSSILEDPVNIYLKPGGFDVTLKVTDKNGCTDTKKVSQLVHVGGPYGSFTSVGSNSCTNQTVTFNATAVNTATYRWDFGDGVVSDLKKAQATHAYTNTGTFKPSLLLIDANGCQTVADGSSIMLIKDTTNVSFSIAPTCIRTNEPMRLVGKHETEEVITWRWLVDGINVGSGTDFQTSVNEPGLHVVTGLASNQFNCVSHVYDTVRIQGPIEMIPNVITPNSDGYNDQFKMIGLENSVWDIDVVNRWGKVVYQQKDYKGDWDGEGQPAGVYYFVLRNALCDEKGYKGWISVHR